MALKQKFFIFEFLLVIASIIKIKLEQENLLPLTYSVLMYLTLFQLKYMSEGFRANFFFQFPAAFLSIISNLYLNVLAFIIFSLSLYYFPVYEP